MFFSWEIGAKINNFLGNSSFFRDILAPEQPVLQERTGMGLETRILVVEDEKEIADLVEMYLAGENFTVCKYYDPKEALEHIKKETFDLALLDIMMPGINGFTLCQEIRKRGTYPVIMLTAKDAPMDKITGLTIGADDYVTKPFLPLELMARVKAQLRRYQKYGTKAAGEKEESEEEELICGGLILYVKAHRCTAEGREISLTPTEFSVLEELCRKKGQVVSGEELFHALWADEYYSKSNNTITVHIRHIREKLGDSTEHPRYIKTVWGVGYKIDG